VSIRYEETARVVPGCTPSALYPSAGIRTPSRAKKLFQAGELLDREREREGGREKKRERYQIFFKIMIDNTRVDFLAVKIRGYLGMKNAYDKNKKYAEETQ